MIDEQYTRKKSSQLPNADWFVQLGCDFHLDYSSNGTKHQLKKEFEDMNNPKQMNLILFYWDKYKIYHYMLDVDNITSCDPRTFPKHSIIKLLPQLMLDDKFKQIPEDISAELL